MTVAVEPESRFLLDASFMAQVNWCQHKSKRKKIVHNNSEASKETLMELALENVPSISWIALNNASFKIPKWRESSKFTGHEYLNLEKHSKFRNTFQHSPRLKIYG